MKFCFLFVFWVLLFAQQTFSQCNNVPVKEAVFNGDFEKGYIKSGKYSDGSSTGFYSDLNYAGDFTGSGCWNDMGDRWGISKGETNAAQGNCCTQAGFFSPYAQCSYFSAVGSPTVQFKDHTKGTKDGFALIADVNLLQSSTKSRNNHIIIWEQQVDIYPGQTYYFSSWLSLFGRSTPTPQLELDIIGINNGVPDYANASLVNITGGLTTIMKWDQFKTTWVNANLYTSAILRIQIKNSTGGPSGLDFALDDISFINSCQNANSSISYTLAFDPDHENLCEIGGSRTLVIKDNKGNVVNPGGGKSIVWYTGNGNPQTEMTAQSGLNSYVVNTPGTYRACVYDPVGNLGCAVSATYVADEFIDVDVKDLVLCTPSSYNLDCGVNAPNGAVASVEWSGPSGTVTTKNYTVNTPGLHTLKVVGTAGHSGCSVNKTFNVTTNLPPVTSTLEYCEGGGVATTLSNVDGKSYKWSTSKTMNPLIGTGTSVMWTPPVGTTGNQTLWLQGTDSSPISGSLGPNTFGSYPSSAYDLSITTTQTTLLNSFVVYPATWVSGCQGANSSKSCTFTITGPVTLTYTQNVTCGTNSTITPNWILPAGVYTLSANMNFYSTTSAGTSTIGAGIVTIPSSGTKMFGNLKFSTTTACDPVPVIVKPKQCCTPPVDNPKIDQVASILTVCTPNKATVITKALTNGIAYKWQVSHDNGTTWTDSAGATGTVNGGKVTLPNIASNGWFRIIIAADAAKLAGSCSKVSDSAIVVIKPLPKNITIDVNPNKTSFCIGEAHNLTASATVEGGAAITYQWKYSGSGTNASTAGKTNPAGTYNYKVIATANGCVDSSAMKTINILPLDVVKILPAGPFCASELPYNLQLQAGSQTGGTWSGTNVSSVAGVGTFDPSGLSATKYKVKYASNGACPVADSIDIQIINTINFQFVNPKSTYCNNAPIDTIEVNLTGGTFSTFSGKGFTNTSLGYFNPALLSAGVDTIYYMKSGGCGDTIKMAINILPLDNAALSRFGPFCESDIPQQLNANTGSAAGTWNAVACAGCVTNTGVFSPQVSHFGKFKVVYTTSGTCPVSVSDTVEISNQMIADITTLSSTRICVDNGLYQVNTSLATSPGGTWTSTPVGLVDASGKFNPALAGVGGPFLITYSVTAQTANCNAEDTVSIIVLPREEASITSGDSKVLCTYDQPYQITTLNSGGVWAGTGVNASGLFDPKISGAGTFPIRYRINGASGMCPDEDTVYITVLAPLNPAVNAAGPFCENLGKQQLTSVVSGGVWSGTGVSASGLFDPSVAKPGSHWIKYSQGGQCPIADSMQIKVEALPRVKIVPDVVGGCAPLTVNLGDSSTALAQIATWDFGDGSTQILNSPSPNASLKHTFTKIGTSDIQLKIQFKNGCVDSARTSILVTEIPVADFTFGPEPASTTDPTISFSNKSTSSLYYLWNFGDLTGNGTQGLPNTSVNKDELVWFDPAIAEQKSRLKKGMDSIPVYLIAANDVCADTVMKKVYIKDVFALYVPNAFTPNGDALNDVFNPQVYNPCDDCTDYEFMVFNRWGELIYNTNNVNEGWNGKRDNVMQDCEIDVYVWRVVYTNSFTKKQIKNLGTVTLLK
jgi:gliding motility-associated-like protein